MKSLLYPGQNELISLARQACDIIKTNFCLGMKREWKADHTPITETDRVVNQLVLDYVRENFPHITVIAEEGCYYSPNSSEYRIFCDPVDGTIPFSQGVPVSSFVISVLKDQVPIAAVIADPFLDRIWSAEKGIGSFLNGNVVNVSDHRTMQGSQVCMVWWKGSHYNFQEVNKRLISWGALCGNPQSIAYFGGLLASGEYEATLFPGQKGWETAAMQLIVEEAGGKATDIHGNELRYGLNSEIEGHIISNGWIHDELVRLCN